MTLPTDKLLSLKALAEGATQSDWTVCPTSDPGVSFVLASSMQAVAEVYAHEELAQGNAAYIAAMHPATGKELIEEVLRLRAVVEAYERTERASAEVSLDLRPASAHD